jgi:uncharacterized membrane protein
LSWKKIAGVIVILASQLLILGREAKKGAMQKHWARYSFISFFAYAALSIAVKYGTIFGANQIVFLFWAILGSLPLFAAETFFRRIPILKFKERFGWLFLMGIASGLGNLFFWNAFAAAPNMGYVNAIGIANVAVVCLLAVKLFGDELNAKKMLGIAGVTAGLLMIVL